MTPRPRHRRTRWPDAQATLMVVGGIGYLIIAVAVAMGAASTPDGAPHTLLNDDARGAIWATSGLTAIITSRGIRRRIVGIVALMLWPACRAGSYLFASFVWWLPDSIARGGSEFGWYSAVFNLFLVSGAVAIAFIPRPQPMPLDENGEPA